MKTNKEQVEKDNTKKQLWKQEEEGRLESSSLVNVVDNWEKKKQKGKERRYCWMLLIWWSRGEKEIWDEDAGQEVKR